jgi:hypothetical protein
MIHSRLLPLVTASVLVSCGAPMTDVAPTDPPPTEGGAIVFAQQQISAESGDCADDGPHCATVQVDTLETLGGGNSAVRENIDLYLAHDLISRLRSFLPEEHASRANTADALAAEFLAQHRAFVAEFPDSPARWSIEITAKARYNTASVATIDITEFAYTGGAHPNTRRRLVSFDIASGNLIGVEDLTTDTGELATMVENQLRADRGLGLEDDLEAAGFWLPEGGFALPDNLGIVADGVLFHWDSYEIAPDAMGPIDVMVPAADLTEIVSPRFW